VALDGRRELPAQAARKKRIRVWMLCASDFIRGDAQGPQGATPCGCKVRNARVGLEIKIEIGLDFDRSKRSSLNLRLVLFLPIG